MKHRPGNLNWFDLRCLDVENNVLDMDATKALDDVKNEATFNLLRREMEHNVCRTTWENKSSRHNSPTTPLYSHSLLHFN